MKLGAPQQADTELPLSLNLGRHHKDVTSTDVTLHGDEPCIQNRSLYALYLICSPRNQTRLDAVELRDRYKL